LPSTIAATRFVRPIRENLAYGTPAGLK
jgi:hypothetical protein